MSRPAVLIAGAGPTGLAAAVELARRGVPLRIFERERQRVPWSKALAVNPRSLALLRASGVTERLLAEGRRLTGMEIWDGGTRRLHLRLDRLPQPYPFILSLPQSRTEAILEQVLAEQGHRVERGVTLELTAGGVQARRDDGQVEALPEGPVLAAEGAHSGLRKALGIGYPGHRDDETFLLADAALDWSFDPDSLIVLLTPRGLLATIPLPGSLRRLIAIGQDPLTLLPPGTGVGAVPWTSQFTVSYRLADRYSEGRVHLAGDAAHIHSPVGGRGMNLGLEDACVFALLASQDRLERYGALRRPVAQRVLAATERFTGLVTLRNPLLRFLRNHLALPVMGTALVQRRLVPAVAGLNYPNPVETLERGGN